MGLLKDIRLAAIGLGFSIGLMLVSRIPILFILHRLRWLFIFLAPFAIVMPLTCDGRTKLSEMLSDFKQIWRMNPPRVKDDPHTLDMWKEEIMVIKENIEKLTGNKITRQKLKEAIETMQHATKAFRRLQDLRKGTREVGDVAFEIRNSFPP